MCKHVLNCNTYIQCKKCEAWYECSECHDEREDHNFVVDKKFVLTCKSCKKVFSRDLNFFTDKDKLCEACGVVWCLPGVTPERKVYDASLTILDEYLSELLDPSKPHFDLHA